MDWTEHVFLFYALVSIPFVVWMIAFVILHYFARRGRIEMRANLLALTGAFIGFCSFLTGWSMIERSYDVEGTTPLFIWLLFTYPLTVLTPAAGIGNAVVLLGAYGLVNKNGAVIEPMSGYLLGWVSVIVLVASVAVPVGLRFDSRWRHSFGSRYLTLTFRRTSRPWMSTERTVAFLFTLVFLAFGAVYLVLNKRVGSLALVFVGLVFVWFMLRRWPRAEGAARERQARSGKMATMCPQCETSNLPDAPRCVSCGRVLIETIASASPIGIGFRARARHLAWIVFVVASYLAVVIALSTIIGAFGPGYSGEEKTRILVDGAIALAVVIPLALIAYRRAVAPHLPRNLIVASVTLFAFFMLMASLESSAIVRTGMSVEEYLVFAGIGLVGPALFHLQTRSRDER